MAAPQVGEDSPSPQSPGDGGEDGWGIWMMIMVVTVRMRIMMVRGRMSIVVGIRMRIMVGIRMFMLGIRMFMLGIRMFMLGIRIENWLVRRRTRNRLIQSDVRDENQPFTDFDDQEMRKKVL